MPSLHEESGLRFLFYSSDLDEPPHVHVDKEGGTLKIIDMNLRKQVKLRSNPVIMSKEEVFASAVPEAYPLIMKVEVSKEEITAFLEDGRKVSIPTD
ncbi:10247_t:CDS:2 [Racocetra persica]|uniref:10247_t:CDS:1 n=1 Tax=Racocetra persica TaxID=160502 RepID=A0ACA9S532_9GLOM|nr:10247_t:CDS:2 [Racocetra persica]